MACDALATKIEEALHGPFIRRDQLSMLICGMEYDLAPPFPRWKADWPGHGSVQRQQHECEGQSTYHGALTGLVAGALVRAKDPRRWHANENDPSRYRAAMIIGLRPASREHADNAGELTGQALKDEWAAKGIRLTACARNPLRPLSSVAQSYLRD